MVKKLKTLISIKSDPIDFRDDNSRHYAIGFFSTLEKYIAAGTFVLQYGSTPSPKTLKQWNVKAEGIAWKGAA